MSKDVWNVLMTNLEIVTSKDHTLSCLSIGSFLLRMSAFLYLTDRMKNSFGEMKMIFLAMGMNNPDVPKYHASFTRHRYNF